MADTITTSSNIEMQYKDWFLYYASYVILERAIPGIEDGLKPVQRRILHAMSEMDDGRFNKVANIIGQSMQYHPHGDASIGDALVSIGQRAYLIETQGNWGDVRTGDQAAAPRYIEARLSKLAKKIAFNKKLTDWQSSYDGRKQEPISLPMKFPLVLLHGADGIAVGLSTKILPHNFVEICNACISHLKGKKVELYPDFQTAGLIDVSQYKWGERGGKVKIRCRIEEIDKQTLVIRDMPFSVTTPQLMESITKANDLGKIKIKKIIDNTADQVEIFIELAPGIPTVQTIDALYRFTKCQVSISTNACIIENKKPQFLSVIDILKKSTEHTRLLLKKELEILIAEVEEVWHYTSLEKIFFEQQLYKELEKKELSWTDVLQAIEKAFLPFSKKLKRAVTQEDIKKLVEKPVRRIHKVDIDDLNNKIKKAEQALKEHQNHLAHITDYTIAWFEELRNDFKDQHPTRLTSIQPFYEKDIRDIAIKNAKLYVNYKEGFVGSSLKKDDFVCDCSDIDDILAIAKDGVLKVVRMTDKAFISKHILYVGIYHRNEEQAFNMIYFHGKKRIYYAKRFFVGGATRDKAYKIISEAYGSKVIYLAPSIGQDTVTIKLSPNSSARNKKFDFDFETLAIGSRNVIGNQLTKYTIHSVSTHKNKGTTKPSNSLIEVYYDALFGRINQEKNGEFIDAFSKNDNLILLYKDGQYEMLDAQEEKIVEASKIGLIEKFNPEKIFTAIYFDKKKKSYFIKRFAVSAQKKDKKFDFLTNNNIELHLLTSAENPTVRINIGTKKNPTYLRGKTNDWVRVMNIKSQGNPIPIDKKISNIEWLS